MIKAGAETGLGGLAGSLAMREKEGGIVLPEKSDDAPGKSQTSVPRTEPPSSGKLREGWCIRHEGHMAQKRAKA